MTCSQHCWRKINMWLVSTIRPRLCQLTSVSLRQDVGVRLPAELWDDGGLSHDQRSERTGLHNEAVVLQDASWELGAVCHSGRRSPRRWETFKDHGEKCWLSCFHWSEKPLFSSLLPPQQSSFFERLLMWKICRKFNRRRFNELLLLAVSLRS